jgi:hypothetical protein
MKKQFIQRLFVASVIFLFLFINSYGQESNEPKIIGPEDEYICSGSTASFSLYIPSELHWLVTGYNWSIADGFPKSTSDEETFNPYLTSGKSNGGKAKVRLDFNYDIRQYDDKKREWVTIGNGSEILFAEVAVINVIGAQVTVTADKNTICQTQTAKITANITSGDEGAEYKYKWSNSNNFSTNSSINVSVAGTYTVIVQNQCFGNYMSSNSATINVIPPPATNVTANPSGKVCPGTSVKLTASGANTYSWSPATDVTPATGSVVTVSPSVTKTYTVSGSNGICAVSKSITVNVHPVTNVQVPKSEILVCGNPASFTLTPSGATNYSYYAYIAGQSPITATGSSYTGTLSPANSPITYTITGSNNDGCSNTSSSKTVRVYAGVPKPETIYGFADGINGPASPAYLCINPPDQTYSITTGQNSPSLTHYYWYFTEPFYTSLGNYSGNGITSVNAHFSTGYTGTKTLKVQATNTCGSAVIASFDNVISGTAPTTVASSPTGPDLVRSTDLSVYQTSLSGAVEWEVTPSNATSNYTKFSSGSVNVYWNASYSGTASIKVRAKNACGTGPWSNVKSVSICGPSNTLTVNGPSTIDNSENTVFSANLLSGTQTWTISPANAVLSQKVLPYARLSVIWNPTFTGNVTASVQSNGYCSSALKTFTVTSGQCDKWEPNNTQAEAYYIISSNPTMDPDRRISGQLPTNDDRDWYYFSNGAGGKNIKITLSNLAADFELELYDSNGNMLQSSINGSNSPETIIYNTTNVGNYYILVRPYYYHFNSQCYYLNLELSSTPFARIGSDFTFVEKEKAVESFSVSPNPTESGTEVFLTIPSDDASSNQRVSITDINGKTVYETVTEFSSGQAMINPNNLKAGIYLIDIEGLGKKKLVVQ